MNTLHIEIIGNSNEDCRFLENNVLTAMVKLGITAHVNCIADAEEVKRRRLGCTPVLTINGRVVSQGQNISSRHIQTFLREATDVSQHGDFLSRMF
ncbi:thioredoxin family protein [Leptothermofonsia sichuanensis E412]|uniref:thioredoxin family protein n=1 Tax=Leptothermofonsia sichuanensis TaxID=2917832 RepID=UPI001CA63B62|nr:thioredoxin family protein [Leptothermofonsia sichuanensis]QZZ20693.1 thioredoxin family protein [Leptothermofonsia sichuanensis E412]